MLSDYIDEIESIDLSLAYWQIRHKLTEDILSKVNTRIKADTQTIHNRNFGLQINQSSSSSWE